MWRPLHAHGEARRLVGLIHFLLILCKNYRNRSGFAEVIAKSLLPLFMEHIVYVIFRFYVCYRPSRLLRPKACCIDAAKMLLLEIHAGS